MIAHSDRIISVGVDLGIHGAVAVLRGDRLLSVENTPLKDDAPLLTHLKTGQTKRKRGNAIEWCAYAARFRDIGGITEGVDRIAITIEDGGTMPATGKEGARKTSSHTAHAIGRQLGFVHAQAMRIGEVFFVRPQEWQRSVISGATYQVGTKDRAIYAAKLCFGDDWMTTRKVKNEGLADAICIARYGQFLR